ncbi:hypothetical protein JOF56_009928 [Kibdelosporangium banguiense]|uniref:Uncharacterized protein n=1 Tax=Kibdelosporangium banguiense TaxID=1365924 RepID=A0ABS4TZX7_9PSEU|nr:hypothetical protein [Kibdelosporangium banguiense]MBP2329543.1 hypothetical protein [Kibdelosporangium banguiense]
MPPRSWGNLSLTRLLDISGVVNLPFDLLHHEMLMMMRSAF